MLVRIITQHAGDALQVVFNTVMNFAHQCIALRASRLLCLPLKAFLLRDVLAHADHLDNIAGSIALTTLGVEPDLFRCGLATTPFTDWLKVIDKGEMDPDAYAFLTEWIGDPTTEAERLRAASPLTLAPKIKAAVLLMHDKKDLDWYYNQTKAMQAALKKAGRTVELINTFDDEKYGYQRHAKWLNGIEDFLQRNMAARR
jgi:hypothetical protein